MYSPNIKLCLFRDRSVAPIVKGNQPRDHGSNAAHCCTWAFAHVYPAKDVRYACGYEHWNRTLLYTSVLVEFLRISNNFWQLSTYIIRLCHI